MVIFYCSRWATAYSRKMRKISNLLSLYLYEFSSCMNKTAQIADQFLNEVWWDLNLSQLVVSDIFFVFRLPFQIWRVFFFLLLLLLQFNIQCWMGLHLVLFFPGLLACLFVWTQVQHWNWRPTSVSDQIWFWSFQKLIEFKICLAVMGHICSIQWEFRQVKFSGFLFFSF